MKRIPPEAFSYYVSLGPDRSYSAVAEHFGVHKRSLTRYAVKHGWRQRLMAVEAKAEERADEAAVDALQEMTDRHLKMLKAVQGRAIEALRSMQLTSASAAVRALDMAMRHERILLGEPTDRTALSIEDTIKREYQRWLGPGDDGGDGTESTTAEGGWDDPDEWATVEDEPT